MRGPTAIPEVRERILELRARGHTLRQTASILNEQGWIPLKGRCFTERNIHGLLRTSDATKVLTPQTVLADDADEDGASARCRKSR